MLLEWTTIYITVGAIGTLFKNYLGLLVLILIATKLFKKCKSNKKPAYDDRRHLKAPQSMDSKNSEEQFSDWQAWVYEMEKSFASFNKLVDSNNLSRDFIIFILKPIKLLGYLFDWFNNCKKNQASIQLKNQFQKYMHEYFLEGSINIFQLFDHLQYKNQFNLNFLIQSINNKTINYVFSNVKLYKNEPNKRIDMN